MGLNLRVKPFKYFDTTTNEEFPESEISKHNRWYKQRYDYDGNYIEHETSNGIHEWWEYDAAGNEIYYKNNKGYWKKSDYNNIGNEVYTIDSSGYWEKYEYDDRGDEIYYENSDGIIKDNRDEQLNEGLNLFKKQITYNIRLGFYDRYARRETVNLYPVNSIDEAVNLLRSFIDVNGIGGSEFVGGEVYDLFYIQVAYISYNGRIWSDNKSNVELNIKLQPIENNINEETIKTMGKLKLLEALTQSDINQIKTIATTEANKAVQSVEKTINKHVQDKDQHLKAQNVKDIIKPDIDKLKDEDSKLNDKITSNKDMDKRIKELIADTMVKYHQTLWIKRGFWTSGLTK